MSNLELRKDIQAAINRHSAENGSDTPDFVLGVYLENCLSAFDAAIKAREAWYGRGENLTETAPEPPLRKAVLAERENCAKLADDHPSVAEAIRDQQ